ncbi:MAG TPA: hypothetical protein VHJ39_13250 [Solirubrobacteraceae bacterium]|nr:hypothetical protein [Solirubrobacteraceae bacterium]
MRQQLEPGAARRVEAVVGLQRDRERVRSFVSIGRGTAAPASARSSSWPSSAATRAPAGPARTGSRSTSGSSGASTATAGRSPMRMLSSGT